MAISIRRSTNEDLPQVLALIHELAVYEKAPDEVNVTLDILQNDAENGLFRIFMAEEEGRFVGMALYYFGYSTWKGKMMYLDDLVVTESHRKKGVGKLLFDALIEEAKVEGAQQVRWHVLDWNEPAIKFYEKIDAELDPEWITGKMNRDQIEEYKAGPWE